MRLGVMMMTRGSGGSAEGLSAIGRKIEQEGFNYLALPDHVVVPADFDSRYPYSASGEWAGARSGECMDILVAATHLAAVTERVGILTSVLVVPHRPVVPTAKMLPTIDLLSGGRLTIGCGAGWLEEEFNAISAPAFAERGQVTNEYIEAFRALWCEDEPEYAGEFVNFANITFKLKPLQRPHAPIWIGAESPPALRRAAKLGDAWYPASINPRFPLDRFERIAAGVDKVRAACEEAGRDPVALDLAYFAIRPVSAKAEDDGDGGRALLTGAPADLAADLHRLKELGFEHVTLVLQTDEVSETLERIEWFAREVRPYLGDWWQAPWDGMQ